MRMKWVKLLSGAVPIVSAGYMLVWWMALGRFIAVGSGGEWGLSVGR